MNNLDIGRLYDATSATLELWTVRLRASVGEAFPEKQQLENHGRARHDHDKLVCGAEGCDKTFDTAWGIRYHQKAKGH